MSHGLSIFQEGKKMRKDTLKLETNADGSKVEFILKFLPFFKNLSLVDQGFYNLPLVFICRKGKRLLVQRQSQSLKTQHQNAKMSQKNQFLW